MWIFLNLALELEMLLWLESCLPHWFLLPSSCLNASSWRCWCRDVQYFSELVLVSCWVQILPYFSSLSIYYGGLGVLAGGLGFLVDLISPRSIVFNRTIFPLILVNSFQIFLGFCGALGSFWYFFFGLGGGGIMFFGTFLLWAIFLLQFFFFFVV